MSVQALLQAAVVAAIEGLDVTGVFDAPPVRAALPYVVIEDAVLADWSTKDMAGREGRFGVLLRDGGECPARLRVLAGAVEETVEVMDRDLGEGWRIAGLVFVRGRIVGYPASDQHYFAGFVLHPADAGQWGAIDAAAEAARARGVAASFVWALPQVMRDGFVHFDQESDMQAFDDVLFPLALGREAEVAPEVSTAIVTSAGGQEKRNADWAEARTSYDVGPGVRSEADIAALLGFFRARMGPARGFRLRDPFDFEGADEVLGFGDGEASAFPLVKHYGETARRITRPVSGSVSVSVDGVATEDFTVSGGVVTFDAPPDVGAVVTASFLFDVPVRFAEDRLTVSRATFLAGAAASVPLVEIRE